MFNAPCMFNYKWKIVTKTYITHYKNSNVTKTKTFHYYKMIFLHKFG